MVLEELVGLIGATVVGIIVFKLSRVYTSYRMLGLDSKKTDMLELKKEYAEFHFKLNNIIDLKLKSESQARYVQVGLLAISIAVAFLIFTLGLKNLGIGS